MPRRRSESCIEVSLAATALSAAADGDAGNHAAHMGDVEVDHDIMHSAVGAFDVVDGPELEVSDSWPRLSLKERVPMTTKLQIPRTRHKQSFCSSFVRTPFDSKGLRWHGGPPPFMVDRPQGRNLQGRKRRDMGACYYCFDLVGEARCR